MTTSPGNATPTDPASHAQPARRLNRRVGGPLLLVGTAFALSGILGAVALVGQDPSATVDPVTLDPASGPVTPLDDPFRLVNADLNAQQSCDDLLSSYQERALELVGPWGWQHASWGLVDARMPLAARADTTDLAGAPAPQAATSSSTGTNVQEAGVDEPDVVKTDGSLLVRVSNGTHLVVHDVTGSAPRELSRTPLPGLRSGTELLLVDDTVVAVAPAQPHRRDAPSRVVTVDLSDPSDPSVTSRTDVAGSLVAVRQHGDVVRLVVLNDLPDLDFAHPRRGGPTAERRALRRNQEQVRATTLEDWLPSLDDAGGDTQTDPVLAVACDDVAVPTTETAPLGTVTTVAFTADAPRERTSVAVATATELAHLSPDRLTLATAPSFGWGWDWVPRPDARVAPRDAEGRTHLFSFALDGTRTSFVASGQVDGAIRDRWSIDSADGVLRLAVGATPATGNFNSVVTLTEQGSRLVESGRLDRLGVNEEIKAVRWFDDLAFVVTFRQVDPLYAVDLSDPARPTLLGELKIPGFSQYLHPVGPHRLIGVGQDARGNGRTLGAQAALFNVTDLTRLRRLDTVSYARDSQAGAATDPRQFTWLPEQRTALTVVTDGWVGRTAWVSALRLAGGKLHESRTEVAHGRAVDGVRLVPLPSGKVVLLAGGDVTFFDVP